MEVSPLGDAIIIKNQTIFCYNFHMGGKRKSYIDITDDLYSELMFHKERTNMAGIAIFNYMKHHNLFEPNHKVTIKKIESWFTRISKSANPKDFNSVLNAYKSVDDGSPKTRFDKGNVHRVPLDKGFVSKLNAAIASRPNLSIRIMLLSKNAPKDLTISTLGSIRRDKNLTICEHHKKFLEDFFDLA